MAPGYAEARQGDLVDWQVWSGESREEWMQGDRPILFSISHTLNGLSYAMGRESFGNEEIARVVNERFAAVAVDKNREPALAEFFRVALSYQKKVDGWPLTALATPQLAVIEGGGYYPPTDSWGNQGLATVVGAISEQWEQDEESARLKAQDRLERVSRAYGPGMKPAVSYEPQLLGVAIGNLSSQFDYTFGGFSLAPKRPAFAKIELLELAIAEGGDMA